MVTSSLVDPPQCDRFWSVVIFDRRRAKHLEELIARPVSIGYSFAISNGLGFARSISGVELVWIVRFPFLLV